MTQKPSKTSRANRAWEALYRAQATLMRQMEQADVWREFTPSEYGVLYALSKAPQGLRMTDLLDDVLLTQAGISRLVGRLEDRGLVCRQPDAQDKRAALIQLTDAGRESQSAIGRAHGVHVSRLMTDRLTKEELHTLTVLAEKLTFKEPS